MGPVDTLTSEMAFKAQVDAMARDYVLEPHLGALFDGLVDKWEFPGQIDIWSSHAVHFHSRLMESPHSSPILVCTEYRTVAGVSGPLVVVDFVKVG